MKSVILGFVLLGLVGVGSTLAVCNNNEEGKQHKRARKIRGKRTRVYMCPFKSQSFYQSKSQKLADRLYKNNQCKFCGCSSEDHTQGAVVPASEPASTVSEVSIE